MVRRLTFSPFREECQAMKILSLGAREPKSLMAEQALTISLHGFPGVKSKQNRDIAEILVEKTGRPVDVLLYRGLGLDEGEFSFEECLGHVRAHCAKRLAEGWEKLDLVGHSWGGFLSLVVASELGTQIDHLVLMSPLLKFAAVGQAAPFFEEKARENPTLGIQNHRRLAREFDTLSMRFSTDELIAKIPASVKVLFLQARGDETTPEIHAHEAQRFFTKKPTFEVIATDHSFVEDRPRIAARIAEFLRS